MDEYLLIAMIAIMVMLFFAVFVIRNVIRRINENSKKYFVDKLQDYDYIIDEKKETLNKLQQQINSLENQIEVEKHKKHNVEINIEGIDKDISSEQEKEIVYDLTNPKYRQEEFFNNYKKIKQKFNVNSKRILEEFLQKHKNDSKNTEYNEYREIRECFSKDVVYEIVTLSPNEQYEVVNKTINNKQKQLIRLEDYNKNNFSILELLKNIDRKIKETDPTIYVYVSNEEINYDYMSDKIITKVYKNMSEGIIIQYHNKMYDYSI